MSSKRFRSIGPLLATFALAACAPQATSPAAASTANVAASAAPRTSAPSTPEETAHRADALARKGDPKSALPLFRQAWEAGYQKGGMAYDAACTASLSGLADEAIDWLYRASSLGHHDLAAIDLDTDLDALRKLPRWAEVRARLGSEADDALRKEGANEIALRYELDAMVWEDQKAREAAIKTEFKDPKAIQTMMAMDAKHLPRVKEILAKYGWPGTHVVGAKGSSAAWLLVQHMDADVPFQRYALDLMTAAAAKDEASKKDVAYLTDRVLLAERKPQRYGTQFATVDGTLVPRPMEDPAGVDERRKSVGLGTMAEYAKDLHETYGSPVSTVTPAGTEKK